MKKAILGLFVIALAALLTVPALAGDGDRDDRGDGMDRIKKYLEGEGFTEDQIDGAMRGLRRIMGELGELGEDEEYELNEGLRKHFEEELGLDEGQIDLLVGLARRLMAARESEESKAEGDRKRGDSTDWIVKAFNDAGMTEVQLRLAMGGLRRVQGELGEWKEEDGDFKLSEELRKFFEEEVGLNEEQIKLVIGCARRLAYSREDSDRKRDDRARPSSDRIIKAFKDAGMTDEQLRPALEGMRRVQGELGKWKEEDGEYELSGELRIYFEDEVGLTEEQIELVIGCARRLAFSREDSDRKPEVNMADIYKRLGVNDEAFAEMQKALKDAGLTDEQIEKALGGILRIAYGVKAAGDDEFELDERMKKYLEDEIGLNEEQIEEVVKLAKQVAESMPERGEDSDRGR
ncbi:MAG: hypothetical protein ACYS8W_13755 [Planctomycetota bacterium]